MTVDPLQALAVAAGISPDWTDFRGQHHRVARDTLIQLLAAMDLPCATVSEQRASLERVAGDRGEGLLAPLVTINAGTRWRLPWQAVGADARVLVVAEDGTRLELAGARVAEGALEFPEIAGPGYYRLESAAGESRLAVAPARAFGIGDLVGERRLWGLAAQLYSLRRDHDGGIGGFAALADLARLAAGQGADALAVSPVHALFTADLGRFSPYAPSSRLFLNPLHADPADILGPCGLVERVTELGLGEALARAEAEPLLDWPRAGTMRLQLLREAFALLRAGPLAEGREDRLAEEFQIFRQQHGTALEDHARFEALHRHQIGEGCWSWRGWPTALRDVRSPEVEAFAREHAEEVLYQQFLQWLADRELGAAHRTARDAGMAIGLIGDLAIGTDSDGSHAWCRPGDLLSGVSVGAPPDALNAQGQSWGLTTFSPRALRDGAYASFVEMLRAALRHAGGVRIDHVLGLNRLWLVPGNASPIEGAYVRYPFGDLLRLIALESWHHRAIVVGEDLGTVPEGFQDRLAANGILGMRVLWFHRRNGLYIQTQDWPRDVMATTSTHDVAPVAAWWAGRDIDWRARVGQYGTRAVEQDERAQRDVDRAALWEAFRHEGIVEGEAPDVADPPGTVVDAAIRHVARTPSRLAIIPLEDLLGLDEQPNLPGTTDEHPNWRRRLPAPATILFADPDCAARLATLREERGS